MAITRTPPLGLTRDQLATFLKDHEQIKAFENLFQIVEAIAPDVVQQVLLQAGNAQATAIQALTALPQAVQDAALATAAADAKAQQALQAAEALRTMVEMLAFAPARVPEKRTRYGQFYDTTTQVPALANTAYPITFDTTDISYGVSIGSPTSRIVVDTEGLYNFQTSIQFDCTGGANREVWVWFRKNGTDIPESAFYLNIQNANSEVLQAFNLLVDMKANDYLEVMWEAANTAARIAAFPATGVHPAVPSIILTVSNNIRSYPS